VLRPDGTITTRTVEQPRSEWVVVIEDHHPGYTSWRQFLSNEQRLAANKATVPTVTDRVCQQALL
jgi:hypothetical protein